MKKSKIDFRKILLPTDGLTIVVIIVGLLIAIFLPELAIRLIGFCVAILGAVALVLVISERLKNIVGTITTPSVTPPPFKVTNIVDNNAHRQVFEDFDESFGSGEEIEPPKVNVPQVIKTEFGEEEVRIVGVKKSEIKEEKQEQETKSETPTMVENTSNLKIEIEEDLDFSDEISGVKFFSKKTNDKKEKDEESNKKEVTSTENEKIDKNAFVTNDGNLKEQIKSEVLSKPKEEKTQSTFIKDEDKQQIKSDDIKTQDLRYKEKELDIPLSSLIENQPIAGQEPRKEFEYFLSRVLMIIRSVTTTRTAVFFLVNTEKHELVLEAIDTDVPNAITSKKKIPIGNDIISRIVLNIKPEILTEINPAAETDLIPYYTRSVGTKSIIGVPVFYKNSIIGILCADSEINEAYDVFTITFLGHFTKILSGLVESYTEKYELMQASRTLNAVCMIKNFTSQSKNGLKDLSESIADAASSLFDFTTLGISLYDENNGNWKISSVRSKFDDNIAYLGKTIDLKVSLAGKAIATGKTVYITKFEKNQIRIQQNESNLQDGYFVSVPIKTATDTYGALFMEGNNRSGITTNDINVLETLASNAAVSIENTYMMRIIQNGALIDNQTGALNISAFYQRLNEEILKSFDTKTNLSLCMFQIDNYASFNPEMFRERNEMVFYHVIKSVRNALKPYYVLGNANENIFGVILPGASLNDASKWAEKLRKDIARSFLEIDNRKFTVTISIGIAEAGANDNIEKLVTNTQKVLKIASQKTNSVVLFE